MTRVFTKRLAFLLLLSFSWQSVAAAYVDCPSTLSANAPENQSEQVSHHQHAMHQKAADMSSMQEHAMPSSIAQPAVAEPNKHSMSHHNMSVENAAHDPMVALTGHHCVGGCVCDYCGVASMMLENDFTSLLSVLAGSPLAMVTDSFDLPALEVPYRPPILT
jgi:hypothetical protein